ncbi:MAG: 4-hydroxy-tetrahydrodipicolinate reductase [Clostridia bacterium]|nr:4-hydroxy-tetrahydrodipicolinate reductase [Clostridia bacterium]
MKILINGFLGKMGQKVYALSKKFDDVEVVYGVDSEEKIVNSKNIFENVELLSDISKGKNCDVVIDFSHSSATESVLNFCVFNHKPLVVATTGHTKLQEEGIVRASHLVPIFKASNLSVSVWNFMKLIRQATTYFEDFDIEIIEKHHAFKVDSPSGTAKTMFDTVKSVRKNAKMIAGRNENSPTRQRDDVGVHSIRGGGVCGEHSIIFLSQNEEIKITHFASCTDEFAKGALIASKFILAQKSGLFDMKSLFKE